MDVLPLALVTGLVPVPAEAVPTSAPPDITPVPSVPASAPDDPAEPPATDEAVKRDYEHAPTGERWRWRRKGLMLGVSIGVSHCLQRGCRGEGHLDDIRLWPSPLFRFELGYRPIPWLAVLLSGDVVIHPMRDEAHSGRVDAEASGTSWTVGPSFYAFFIERGALDPYVNLLVGYWRYRTRLEQTASNTRWATVDVYDRAVARVGLGLNIHVSASTMIGFRLDQNVPFAGRHCHVRQPVPTSTFREAASCTSVRKADPMFTAGLPYFWELGIHVAETLDPQEIRRRITQGKRRRRR